MKRWIPEKADEYLVLTRQQVRDVDAWAIRTLGIPGVVLMENAGAKSARWILDHLQNHRHPSVVIVCGAGNNGGDGYVIARHLLNHRVPVTVALCAPRDKIIGDALIHLTILDRMKAAIVELPVSDEDAAERLYDLCPADTLVVDALFGTGLSGPVRPPYTNLIDALNASEAEIIAVDIPSGLDADTGLPLGTAVFASVTITFVAPKKGFLNPDSEEFTGEVFIAPIGVDPHLLYPKHA
jgi:NAD(P)H-hydrate epimerase